LLPLVVALSSIVISLAGGLVIAYEVTGISHILGLLLATTAIGIAVDFWLHFWIHVRAGHGGQQAIANIRPAVGVSFITTIAGLVAVALVAIPVLSYSAIFVCGALFINWLLVVYLIPPRVGKPATGDRIPAGRVLPRPVAWCLVVACAGVAVYGLATRYHVDDDPSRLIQQTPHLVEQDATVMGLLGARDAGRYLVIDAGSPDDLLDTEKDLLSTLGPDALSRVQAISRLVPDREMQIENRELYAETRNSLDDGLLNEYLSGIQLDSLQWEPPGKGFYPLLWVLDQPWADMERSRILHCDEELCQSFIRAPAGVLQQLEAKCGENPSCAIVDPSLNRSNAFLDLRTNLVRSFVFAIAAIFVVLFIRYRLRALPMLLPLLLASVTGLAVVALLGMPITVFSLAALFPLLGLSVDYSIFIAESRASVASTLYAILASAMTTFASFGILSLSSVPAVKYYSIPVAAGILVAWISAQLLISTDKSKDKGKNENKM
jgi:predicted exporter